MSCNQCKDDDIGCTEIRLPYGMVLTFRTAPISIKRAVLRVQGQVHGVHAGRRQLS
jgi:hypothetical protein